MQYSSVSLTNAAYRHKIIFQLLITAPQLRYSRITLTLLTLCCNRNLHSVARARNPIWSLVLGIRLSVFARASLRSSLLYSFAFDYENVLLLMAPAYREIQASLICLLYPHSYPAPPNKYY